MDYTLNQMYARWMPYFPQLEAWIDGYIQDAAAQAQTVASLRFPCLSSYFSPETLDAAKVVITAQIQKPPFSRLGLHEFAEFEEMDVLGITYKSTFFIKPDSATDESLHFHELIHVVQWRTVGPKNFLLAYGAGYSKFRYRNAPLEVMAYDLQDHFDAREAIPDLENLVEERTKVIIADPLLNPYPLGRGE